MKKNKNKNRRIKIEKEGIKEKKQRTEIDGWIEEFLEYLSIERNYSNLTIRNYRHYLRRFSTWLTANFAEKKLCDLDLKVVKQYKFFLARYMDIKGIPLKEITQVYHLISLRSFLKFLSQNNVETLEAEKIELPKTKTRPLKFLTNDHLERFLNGPYISNLAGLRDKAILEILFSTGLRVSELVKLNKDQINFKKKEFVVIGKGSRPRVVFLSQRSIRWLKEYLAKRKDDWKPLFVRMSGKKDESSMGEKMRLSARSIQRIVAKYVRKTKLPIKITPHGLRHSFATDLLSHGADIRSVQEMLGHKNITTTQIYTYATNAQLRKVHEKFHSGNE